MPVGIGSGLGGLFGALGRSKLDAARMAVYQQQMAQEQAVRDAQVRNYDAKTALDSNQLEALGAIHDALTANGVPDAQAQLDSAVMRAAGGANPKNSSEALGRLFLLHQIGDRKAASRAAGFDMSKVSDGTAYNPMEAPGDQTMVTTDVGRAMANARNASAAASMAAARHSNALTANTGPVAQAAARAAIADKYGLQGQDAANYALTGDLPGGPQNNPQVKNSNLSEWQAKTLFGRPVKGPDGQPLLDANGRAMTEIDPDKMADFVRYQSQHGTGDVARDIAGYLQQDAGQGMFGAMGSLANAFTDAIKKGANGQMPKLRPMDAQTLAAARAAIAGKNGKSADPADVRQRLVNAGFDPTGL